MRASRELKRWSNTYTILASPTEQVSKYSIPYFLARLMASTLVTGFETRLGFEPFAPEAP